MNRTVSVQCKLCLTPLNTQQEFIGHHVLSHELTINEAWRIWELMTSLKNTANNIKTAQTSKVGVDKSK